MLVKQNAPANSLSDVLANLRDDYLPPDPKSNVASVAAVVDKPILRVAPPVEFVARVHNVPKIGDNDYLPLRNKIRHSVDEVAQKSKTIYSQLTIKNLINFLTNTNHPGAIGRFFSSLGVVLSTITALWTYPMLTTVVGIGIAGMYFHERSALKPEESVKHTRAALGGLLLGLNYLSPLLLEPCGSPFFFMSYLYFSFYSFNCVASTDEKTKTLSNLSYYTGINLFVLDNPLVYLAALNILAGGHADDVINRKLDKANLGMVGNAIDYAARGLLLSKMKDTARTTSTDYLVSICDNVTANFKYMASLAPWVYKEYISKAI